MKLGAFVYGTLHFLEEEKAISSYFRFTLADSGLGKRPYMAKIGGPDAQYGLSRKFADTIGEVIEPDGSRHTIFHLRDPGFYESSQSDGHRKVTRLYYRLSYAVDTWEWSLALVSPMELFKEIATEHGIFGWPAWFGRLFSPHLAASVHVAGEAGVGELFGLMVESGELRLYLSIWVATFNALSGVSEVFVCPIQVHDLETPATLAAIAFDLRAKAIYPQELLQLPRGDWNSGGTTT